MKSDTYHLYLTMEERSRVLQSLVHLKNSLHSQGRYTDAVDEVIFKIAKAKKKNMRVIIV